MLQTPDVLGPSNAEMQQLHEQWSTFGAVQARLRQEGFTPLPQPMYACPSYLDADVLTSQNSRTLTMEFAKYKAWRDFTAERLVYSRQILLETRNEMRAIEARVKGEARSKKMTKEEVQETAKTNPRYNALRLQEQENEQLELHYETKEKEYSSAVALISRVITIRGQDIEQNNRGGSVGASYDHSSLPRGGFG